MSKQKEPIMVDYINDESFVSIRELEGNGYDVIAVTFIAREMTDGIYYHKLSNKVFPQEFNEILFQM